MTVQILTATLKSVNFQLAKTGNEGINVVFDYPDGSEWGKKIYQWFWWDDKFNKDMLKMAQLADATATEDTYRDVFTSHKLCGLEVDLQVDQSDERFWRILDFGAVGTLTATEPATAMPNDDIPF